MLRRLEVWLLAALTLLAASGATCVPRPAANVPLAPAAFAAPPSLDELLANLHASSQRVFALHSDSASLSTPGMPALRATLSLEKPRRFRLRARLLGPKIDLGSNDAGLWFWANSDPQHAVYQARHEQLAVAGSTPFPVDAAWLIQAFGLVDLHPSDHHEGPLPHPDGTLEIRSQINRPLGTLRRSLLIDGTYGWILEQTIWDSSGRALAHITASEHRHYEHAAVSLPHHIEIELPPAQLTIILDVDNYWINQLPPEAQQLWEMPPFSGLQRIDLAGRRGAGPRAPGPSLGLFSDTRRENRMSFRPRMRGYSPPGY